MHSNSPLLDHCPPTLPAQAYFDPEWYAREQHSIWRRHWIYAGRLPDLAPGTIRPLQIGGAPVILCRDGQGTITAFHNTCRHRGAELCAQESPLGRLITCPYHAWAYATDGQLISVAHATPTDDFVKQDHGLIPVSSTIWNGCIFLSLATDPPPLAPDLGLGALDNWPMADLRIGHRMTRYLACNWKVFWENYNECLHCPGIHPELCEMVPVYKQGIMSATEAPDWTPDSPQSNPLKQGAQSWTMTGAPCGPIFPNLTDAQKDAGFTFVTLYPTMFIVAHVDYVRCVSLDPTGPETTRLTAEWLFSDDTFAQPSFDAVQVAAFASLVMEQDALACEMNQRGLRSPAFRQGTLMPQEFDLHRFHCWITTEMAKGETP